MRAKQSQAPERAEGKLFSEGKILMEVTAEEQRFIELLRVEELTLDPEAFNHRLLKTMLALEKAQHLSPCGVEKLTGIPHQYHQKMHPTDSDSVEPHISLFTLLLLRNSGQVSREDKPPHTACLRRRLRGVAASTSPWESGEK